MKPRGRGPRSLRNIEPRLKYVAVLLAAVGMITAGVMVRSEKHADLVVGKYEKPTDTLPTITVPPPELGVDPIPAPAYSSSLLSPNGQAYGKALAFNSKIPIKDGLVFMLIVGSDARPGQDLHKTRTDSLHVVAIDPATRSGTIVGIPRDTFVNVPGHGEAKINTAMGSGGPALLMQTVREFTGLPIQYYVLTGFQGFSEMVDDLGGVDVYVPRNMSDKYSGAFFAQGYHHFNGEQALAFSRDRHSVKYGDFTRSENQGLLMLATLAKLRSEVSDDGGLRRWLNVLANHSEIEIPAAEMESLAALARRLDPSSVQNVVMPGKTGTAKGGQSVVFPSDSAAAIWGDLRDDARLTNAPSVPNEGSTNTTDTTDGSDSTTSTTEYFEDTTTTSPYTYEPTTTTTTTSSGGVLG